MGPHPFFMELAALYQVRLSERASVHFYGGPRAEPALGPGFFGHRISNTENPVGVLGHDHQDGTHSSNNVVTAGFSYGPVTVEASGFHGTELGERHRWRLERGGIDSASTHLTISPTSRWTGQFSFGRINARELSIGAVQGPIVGEVRLTSSVTYVRPLSRGHWATTLIWGRTRDLPVVFAAAPATTVPFPLPRGSSVEAALAQSDGGTQSGLSGRPELPPPVSHKVPGVSVQQQIFNSYLAESTLFFKSKHWIWGRVESEDKDSSLLFEESPLVLLIDDVRFTRVQAYTVGYERELPRFANWLSTGLGSQFTYYGTPDNLRPIYGDHPLGVQVFLRFRLAPAER